MRIRTIKPDFFKDEDLAGLPFRTRLLFVGLWCLADREGRLEDRPRMIKAEIFPYDQDITEERIEDMISALEQTGHGALRRYEVEGRNYLHLPNFLKHQRINHREAQSTLPEPPKARARARPGTPGQTQARPGTPRHAQARPGGREGKGRERKGREASVGPASNQGPKPEAGPWLDSDQYAEIERRTNGVLRRFPRHFDRLLAEFRRWFQVRPPFPVAQKVLDRLEAVDPQTVDHPPAWARAIMDKETPIHHARQNETAAKQTRSGMKHISEAIFGGGGGRTR